MNGMTCNYCIYSLQFSWMNGYLIMLVVAFLSCGSRSGSRSISSRRLITPDFSSLFISKSWCTENTSVSHNHNHIWAHIKTEGLHWHVHVFNFSTTIQIPIVKLSRWWQIMEVVNSLASVWTPSVAARWELCWLQLDGWGTPCRRFYRNYLNLGKKILKQSKVGSATLLPDHTILMSIFKVRHYNCQVEHWDKAASCGQCGMRGKTPSQLYKLDKKTWI